MKGYWLAKQEPSGPRGYPISQLCRDKTTVWDGVHNNLALKHMRAMKKGDLAIFYHTGSEKCAAGIMEITSNPYPNPDESDERYIVVDVKFKGEFENPVTLDAMKRVKAFADWELLRISRLSVMPVPKPVWDRILKMSRKSA